MIMYGVTYSKDEILDVVTLKDVQRPVIKMTAMSISEDYLDYEGRISTHRGEICHEFGPSLAIHITQRLIVDNLIYLYYIMGCELDS